MPHPSVAGRWSRWALVLGLGFALTPPLVTTADARPARARTAVKAHARAEPHAARKRRPLLAPAAARVAVGPEASADLARRDHGELAASRAAAAIDKLLRGSLKQGTTSLYVVDAATGRELFALRPDERLNPASNVKMISTAAALDLLGADFRYRTRALGPAPDALGRVVGDLYLHGSYDPTLAVDGLEDLAAQVAAGGVKAISGDVVVGGVPTRDGLYRSRIHVEVAAGVPGAPPRVEIQPAYDFVEVVNQATTGKRARKGKLAITSELVTRADGRQRLLVTIKGTLGKGGSKSAWLWTKERHLHAAHVLRAALARAGVVVEGDVAVRELPAYVAALADQGQLPVALGEHRSAPLADIVAQVNKRSINWLADRVIATAALSRRDDAPSMANGIDAMYAWLDRRAGIARADAVIDTGSGLSYRTELSTRQLVRVLRSAAGLDHLDGDDARGQACALAFHRSLSIAGVDGTLRARFRDDGLRGRVLGKTGTLSNVVALSGILVGPGQRELAFALVTNGHAPSYKRTIRAGHEDVLAILDRYLATSGGGAALAAAIVPAVPAPSPPVGDDSDADDERDDPPSPDGAGR